jgi:hypothetical protein
LPVFLFIAAAAMASLPAGKCGLPLPQGNGSLVVPYYVETTDCTYELIVDANSQGNIEIDARNLCTNATFRVLTLMYHDITQIDAPAALTKLRTQAWYDRFFPSFLSQSSLSQSMSASLSPPNGQASQAFLSVDLNGDGNLDSVSVGSSGIQVDLLAADGSVLSSNQYAVGFSTGDPLNTNIVAADFNGDGNLDLAASNGGNAWTDPGGIAILLGNGDGTFSAPRLFPAGLNPVSIAAADFNGDGRIDLAAGNQWSGTLSNGRPVLGPGTVSLLLGKGDGTFAAPVTYPTGEDSLGVPGFRACARSQRRRATRSGGCQPQ